MNHYINVIKKYAVFDGRASQAEYWMFFLFNIIAAVVLSLVDGLLASVTGIAGLLGGIYSLALLLPGIGVTIRRLHDTNRSGWFILLGLIPLVGAIILLIFLIQGGTEGDNQYGSDPKAAAA